MLNVFEGLGHGSWALTFPFSVSVLVGLLFSDVWNSNGGCGVMRGLIELDKELQRWVRCVVRTSFCCIEVFHEQHDGRVAQH